MARELPIQNGRLTTDLDADGHRINNLAGGLSTVAWSDVTGKPTFATVATSGAYSDLSGKPTLATVATSGSYSDLSNKPTIPTVDPSLSPTSENPVQNKAVAAALGGKRGVLDLAVYAEQYAWTFSDGIDHGVLIQDSIAAGWGAYPDRPWVVTGADFNILPPSEYFFATKAEAEAVTEFSYYLMDGGDTIEITATRSTYVGPVSPPDSLAKVSQLPSVPSASTSAPLMDGTASAGSSGAWARGDHVHPHDTSKQNAYTFSAVQTISSAGTEQSPNEVTPVDAQNKRVSVEAENAYIAVALPAASANGHIRDMMLTLDCSTLADGEEPTVTWDTHFHPRTDAGTDFACAAGVRNVYYISEYAAGEFVVGGWQETEGGSGT